MSKPIAKFKVWFDTAGDLAVRKENEELRKLVKSMERALQADDSKDNNASVILGAAEPQVEQARQSLALLRSAATSPFGEVARVAKEGAAEVKPDAVQQSEQPKRTAPPELEIAVPEADIFTTPVMSMTKDAAQNLENMEDLPDQGIGGFEPA